MAATTVKLDSYRGTGVPGNNGWLVPLGGATGATTAMYGGTLLIVTAGYWLDGADSASSYFGGVLIDNAAIGDLTGYSRRHGVFAFAMTGGSVAADAGQTVYVKTNAEVGLVGDTSNDVPCGKFIAWDTSDGIWVSGAKCLIDITGF